MISVLFALLFFAWLGRAVWRRPTFLFVGIFLIWQIVLKVLSVVYLDLAGPIYADEVMTEVGGQGSSAPLLIFFVWMPLFFIYVMLGPRAASKPPLPERHVQQGGVTFGDVVVFILGLFVVCLYGDMLIRGSIPLFTGTDRFEYEGGVFHNFLQDYIFLITFLLGYVFTRSRIVTGVWDLRCVALLFAFFVYLVLTGHRFGAFYVMVSFLCLALAGLFFAKEQGWPVAAPPANASLGQVLARSPVGVTAAGIAALALVAAAMVNNLFFVRGYGEEAGEELVQRLLVQPVHLYWLTWDRLHAGDISGAGAALDFMYNEPFDATRNTGIQYLMFLSLGEQRSSTIFLEQGTDYAGGYPEIIIELGGIWFGSLLAIIGAVITAFMYRLCVVSVCRGHFLTAMSSIYVCYGLLSLYLGGMMNFALRWSYWVKIALLIGAVITDRFLERSGIRVFPWVMLPRRAPRQDQPASS